MDALFDNALKELVTHHLKLPWNIVYQLFIV